MKFIFKIKIKNGHTEEEYINAWKGGSTIIQKSLGAKGTRLYRKIDEHGTLIAIAEWETKELRDEAMRKLNNDLEYQAVLKKHKNFGELEVMGNFEEVAYIGPNN